LVAVKVKPTSAVLVAQVGEAPDVAQADSVADAGEEELEDVAPLFALGQLLFSG